VLLLIKVLGKENVGVMAGIFLNVGWKNVSGETDSADEDRRIQSIRLLSDVRGTSAGLWGM